MLQKQQTQIEQGFDEQQDAIIIVSTKDGEQKVVYKNKAVERIFKTTDLQSPLVEIQVEDSLL